jgi:Na+/melibiose symporter-like transporter
MTGENDIDPTSDGPDKKTLLNRDDVKRDGLSQRHVMAYSIGHFNNDLCAVMWFVYLSWYLKEVVGLSPEVTAAATLSGQIMDGITTPIVGVMSDKINTRCGQRMPWYILGTIAVIPCFMGIFTNPTFILDNLSETQKNLWYITLPGLFNIGWASV